MRFSQRRNVTVWLAEWLRREDKKYGKKQFGYGCMRLPLLNAEDPVSFDYPLIEKLFDAYMEQGFTYFDTAYTYHGYHGEEAVRKALVERHPRESFELATKLPLRDFKDGEDMERIFNEQLDHCGVEYFDYYLLHNMGTNVYEKCRKYDAFGFAAGKKAEGKINIWECLSMICRNFWTRFSERTGICLILSSCRSTIWTGNSRMCSPVAAWKWQISMETGVCHGTV